MSANPTLSGRTAGLSAPHSRARVAILVGFGALFIVAALGSLDMWLALRQIQRRSSEILDDYLQRDEILQRIRTGAFLSTTLLRDFVLDPDPSQSAPHLAALRRYRTGLDVDIARYAPLVDANERRSFEDLESSLQRYWQDVAPVFEWTSTQRRRNGFRFLAAQILPQRARLLELTDAISAINQQELRHRQQRLNELYSQTRGRLGVGLILALLFGVSVAAVSFAYLTRLERQARARIEEILRTREELERLSVRLVEAQEQERRAISRELHDEVGQSLSALLMDVGNAAAVTPPDARELTERHASIRALAEQSLRVIRNMALLLRPSMLDDLGLAPALEWQAREISRRAGIEVQVDADECPDDLPEAVRTCVYRVVQEALNNCLRHASATRAEILLRRDGARLLILVRDNGHGFDPRTRRGAGLIGMEERVRILNGTLRVESSPGHGSIVQAELPLTPVQEATE
ncbi:MAG: histidine kinase [Bryobacteraceae bacterium]